MKYSVLILIVLGAFILCMSPMVVLATDLSSAKVASITGEAKFLKKGGSEWQPLTKGEQLTEGDKIMTASASQVELEMVGSNRIGNVIVRPDTEFTLQSLHHDPETKVETTLLDVEVGNILVKAEKLVGESKFEVKTPTSIVGIRGTTFEVQVSKS